MKVSGAKPQDLQSEADYDNRAAFRTRKKERVRRVSKRPISQKFMLLDDWHTSPKEKQTHQKMGTQSRGSKTKKGQDSLAANV